MAVMTEVGERKRLSFSKIDEVLEVPNLIEIQKHTYEWFKEEASTKHSTTYLRSKISPVTWCWSL